MTRVLVIGGSGELGRLVGAEVRRLRPDARLLVGDRRPDRGALTASRMGGSHVLVDASCPASIHAALDGVDVAIVALAQREPLIQRACSLGTIPCIDVTPDAGLIAQIRLLDDRLRDRGVPSIVMAGLFPGLSAMLALHAVKDLDEVLDADVALLQHVDARAGRTGVADMLRLIAQPVTTGSSRAPGFTRRFPGAPTLREIESAERAVLADGLTAAQVRYWTGWNDAAFTALVAALVRAGVLPRAADVIARLRRSPENAPEPVEMRVRVRGTHAGSRARRARSFSLTATSDYGATATTVAALTASVLDRPVPGVRHPAEVIDVTTVVEASDGAIRLRELGAG